MTLFLVSLFQGFAGAADWLYVSTSNNDIVRYDVSLANSAAVSSSREVYAASGTSPTNLTSPDGIVFDSQGNLYVANREGANGSKIIKITSSGVRTVFASGLSKPIGLGIDFSGNLYAVNETGSTISKITPGGTVSSFATGLNAPYGLVTDSSGNVYAGNRGGNGTVTRYDSTGSLINPSPFAGSNLNNPRGMDFSASGDLYVANFGNHTIAKIQPDGTSSTYLTLANTGPNDVAFDSAGNLYVANNGNRTIHKYNPNGEFQFSWGLSGPRPQFLAFVPEPSTWILGFVATAALSVLIRRSAPAR